MQKSLGKLIVNQKIETLGGYWIFTFELTAKVDEDRTFWLLLIVPIKQIPTKYGEEPINFPDSILFISNKLSTKPSINSADCIILLAKFNCSSVKFSVSESSKSPKFIMLPIGDLKSCATIPRNWFLRLFK
jgi:hypothetical protein